MDSKRLLLLLALAAALPSAAAAASPQTPTRVKYIVVERPSGARLAQPQYRVTSHPTFTEVSVFAGRKPTGGYDVVITGVDRSNGVCTVRYRVEEPPADAIVPQVLTYPSVTLRISGACADVKVDPPLPRSKPITK